MAATTRETLRLTRDVGPEEFRKIISVMVGIRPDGQSREPLTPANPTQEPERIKPQILICE